MDSSQPLREVCKHGHILTEELIYTNPKGGQECRLCRRASKEKYRKANNVDENSLYRFGGQREFVLDRDQHKCVICGMTQDEHRKLWNLGLTIDHIDGNGRYSEKQNNDPDNLQTLCLRCHGKKDHGKPTYEYAIYQGKSILGVGTDRELADRWKTKPKYIRSLAVPNRRMSIKEGALSSLSVIRLTAPQQEERK